MARLQRPDGTPAALAVREGVNLNRICVDAGGPANDARGGALLEVHLTGPIITPPGPVDARDGSPLSVLPTALTGDATPVTV